MSEVWKDIYYYDLKKKEWVDYRGYYQVSNFGRIRSVDRYVKCGKGWLRLMKGIILVFNEDKDHYLRVILSKFDKIKNCGVHRLVAYMFIPNPNNLPDVNHKDENKQNNMCTNLEWCDYQYNNNYGTRKQRICENNKGKGKTVLQYTLDGIFLNDYVSLSKAAEEHNITCASISECCKHKTKSAGGYRWEYL